MLIPALLFCVGFFILVRLFVQFSSHKAGRNSVSLTISGFFGFFVALPVAFGPHADLYLLVPLMSLGCGALGVWCCIVYGVNPVYPQEKNKTHENEKNEPGLGQEGVVQLEKESLSAINQELKKLKKPIELLNDVVLQDRGSTHDYKYITIGTSGVKIIHPCNWAGFVEFFPDSVARSWEHKDDIPMRVRLFAEKEQAITSILKQNGLGHVSVETIVCVSNPTMNFVERQEDKYKVVRVEELTELIRQHKAITISSNQITEIKRVLTKDAYK